MFGKNVKIDIVDFHKEARKRERKEARKEIIGNVKNFVMEHPAETATIAVSVLVFCTAGVKGITKAVHDVNMMKQVEVTKAMQDLRIYDRSLGIWWNLSKKLTNSQMIELDARKAAGESIGNILKDMGVLAK